MSDKSTGGPNIGLLLLIPAAAIVARAAMRHRQMLWAEVGEPGARMPQGPADVRGHHGHHSHRGPFGAGFDGAARGEFRLPPRIEWMLETWHDRAHEADASRAAAPDATPTAPDAPDVL